MRLVDTGDSHDYGSLRKTLDESPWTREHSTAAVSLGASFFLWGLVLGLGPLVTTWPFVTRPYVTFILLAAPVGLLTGSIVMGALADRFGRKRLYIATLVPTVAGLAGIVVSRNAPEMLVSLFLAEFGLGGDETVSLTLLGEMLPVRSRGKSIVLLSNVANISVALISLAFLLAPRAESMGVDKLVLAFMAVAGLLIAIVSRYLIPESRRWRYVKTTREPVAERTSEYWIRFTSLSLLAIAVIVGFPLTGYLIGPYLFPKETSLFGLVVPASEAVTGIVAAFLIVDRIGRRPLTLIAFLGGFVTVIVLLLLLHMITFAAFIVILAVTGVFGELGWAMRVVLEPEVFSTVTRSTSIGA